MTEISMLAIDLAKRSFQVYAIGLGGMVIYNRALSRSRLIVLLAGLPVAWLRLKRARRRITGAGWRRHKAMRSD